MEKRSMRQERVVYYEQNCKMIDYEIDRIQNEINKLQERKTMMLNLKEQLKSTMDIEKSANVLKKVI